MVWAPRAVPVGWAPYHYGHWVFIAPWGWTWVDEAPWGFAPFHYGRWCLVGAGWVWVPGPIVVRPVYAPALVAFVGGGGLSFSMAFGGGFTGVAWFPLGPRDVFVPAYRCSPRYVQNVNITNTRVVNITQVTNVSNNVVIHRNVTNVNYMYAKNAGAVTAVSKETFVNARPVSGAAVRVTSEQIQRARVVESAPVAPTRASYISSAARPAATKPAVPIAQRPVVVRLTPSEEAQRGTQQNYPTNPPPFRQTPGAQPNRPFHPPQGSTSTTPPPSAERPAMRYTPPVKARDEMYDVHAPLNRKPPQAGPKPEERPAQPPHQQEGRRQSGESPREK